MTVFLNTPEGTLSLDCRSMLEVKQCVLEMSGIPASKQKYHRGGLPVNMQETFNPNEMQFLTLYLACEGGKGGFGSLLKNQAQTRRKVTNWDQSREVDGKRIGNSNNESGLVEFYRKRKEEKQSKPNVEEEEVVQVPQEGEVKLSQSYMQQIERNERMIKESVNHARLKKTQKETSKRAKVSKDILAQLDAAIEEQNS